MLKEASAIPFDVVELKDVVTNLMGYSNDVVGIGSGNDWFVWLVSQSSTCHEAGWRARAGWG